MNHEKAKQRIVTFKLEEEFAGFLDTLPNKSEFIRKALLAALMEPCPVCNGKGSVPRSLRADLQKIFAEREFVPCSQCGYDFPLDAEKKRKGLNDKDRIKQYMKGGEFYCDDCYPKTQACEDCGEHVAGKRMAGHKLKHVK
ncbi:MAG: hypothetical protein WCT04_13240 [Planctomycetota bacterium]